MTARKWKRKRDEQKDWACGREIWGVFSLSVSSAPGEFSSLEGALNSPRGLRGISASGSAILIGSCGVIEPRGRRGSVSVGRLRHAFSTLSWGLHLGDTVAGMHRPRPGLSGRLINFHQHEDPLQRSMTCDGRGSERQRRRTGGLSAAERREERAASRVRWLGAGVRRMK